MSVDGGLDGSPLYTPQDIAQRWGVTAETVRACIRSGGLEAFRIGPRLFRVRAEALAEYETRKAAKAALPKGPPPLTQEERAKERRTSEARRAAYLAVMIARGRTS
ncbi:MAG: helix-turn-helix domain-containing protein [Janthinobacterium lividum]